MADEATGTLTIEGLQQVMDSLGPIVSMPRIWMHEREFAGFKSHADLHQDLLGGKLTDLAEVMLFGCGGLPRDGDFIYSEGRFFKLNDMVDLLMRALGWKT